MTLLSYKPMGLHSEEYGILREILQEHCVIPLIYNEVGKGGVAVDTKCGRCDKTFKSAKRKNEHEKSYGGGTCNLCGKMFSTFKTAREHYVAQHTQDFKCEICGKCIGNQSKLTRHKVVHDKSRGVLCECGKKFSRVDYLKKHKKQVHNA